MRRLVKLVLPTAAFAIIATASSGCAQSSAPGAVTPTTATPTTATSTTTQPTGAPTASATQPTMAFEQACTPDVLLPLMKRKFDNPAAGLVIERVDIRRCANGYVHLFAISRQNPTGPANFENEQLFMHFVDGQWQSISEGTGISCSDTDLRPAEMFTACRALGYRS